MPYKDPDRKREYHRLYQSSNMNKKVYDANYRKTHKEQIAKYLVEYRKNNLVKCRANALAWHHRNKEHARAHHLSRRYGLTIKQYAEMLDAQGNKCLICDVSPNGKPLSVDHNHKTGKVRGLLCGNCNRKLGWMEAHIKRASAYLGVSTEWPEDTRAW